MMQSPSVLIVSVAFHHSPIPSDKQFVRDLAFELAKSRRVIVLSLSDCAPYDVDSEFTNANLRIINLNRIFHRPTSTFYDGLIPHSNHSAIRNMLELFFTIIFAGKKISKALSQEHINLIHVTDQVGPVAWFLRKIFPNSVITIAKPTSRIFSCSIGSWIYRLMLRINLNGWDSVIPYTYACEKELKRAGVTSPSAVVHWGIQPENDLYLRQPEVAVAFPKGKFFMVSDRGMIYGNPLDLIKLVTELSLRIGLTGVISIRKSMYHSKFVPMQNDHVVVECSKNDYYSKLRNARFLFCPNTKPDETTLIPLLWLEAMKRNTPVLTSVGSGVDEVIDSLENGIVYGSSIDLLSWEGTELINKIDKCAIKCSERTNTTFSVVNIAKLYSKLWDNVLKKKRL